MTLGLAPVVFYGYENGQHRAPTQGRPYKAVFMGKSTKKIQSNSQKASVSIKIQKVVDKGHNMSYDSNNFKKKDKEKKSNQQMLSQRVLIWWNGIKMRG